MSVTEIGILFFTLASLALIPSSSVALVVAHTASSGFAKGTAVVAGIVAGDLIFASLAIGGLTTLSGLLGSFFLGVKYLAASYLLWLGISIFRSCNSSGLEIKAVNQKSTSKSFLVGLLFTLSDVKAIFFYASLFPTFVGLSQPTTVNLITIAITIIVGVGGGKLVYVFLAKKIVAIIQARKLLKATKIISGNLMIVVAIYLIFSR